MFKFRHFTCLLDLFFLAITFLSVGLMALTLLIENEIKKSTIFASSDFSLVNNFLKIIFLSVVRFISSNAKLLDRRKKMRATVIHQGDN